MPSKNKKLLFFQPSLRAGGAERFSLDLAKTLREKGYEISFLLFADGGYFLEEAQNNNFPTVVLKKNFKLDLVNLWRAKKEIAKIKPDIIVCRLGANLYGPYIKGRAKILAIEDNVNLDENKLMTYLKSLAYKKTDKIVAVSKTVASDIADRYNLNPKQIEVIYNGLDFNRFPQYLKKINSVPLLVSVGRLEPQKNYPLLLKALAEIKTSFKCQIAGEGSQKKLLQTMILDLDLSEKVSLVGLKKNIGEFLSAADAFVLPSLWEGLGIVILEAGYYGLPIVASDIPSICEVISERNGYLFKSNNQNDLKDKLEYVLGNPDNKALLEKGAILREDIRNHFSITEMTEDYHKILQAL